MDVIAEVGVAHDEHRDVGDAADVCELDQLVLHQPAVHPDPEQGLDQGNSKPNGNAYWLELSEYVHLNFTSPNASLQT